MSRLWSRTLLRARRPLAFREARIDVLVYEPGRSRGTQRNGLAAGVYRLTGGGIVTVDQVPSFATRSWSDRPWTVGGVRVEIEGTAANQCDLELVATRCKALIRELSIQAGVCGGESDESSTLILPFELSAGPAPTPNVAVYVHGVLRAVTPDDCVVGNQHRTGWALGLDRVESLAVALVERVCSTIRGYCCRRMFPRNGLPRSPRTPIFRFLPRSCERC